MDRSEIAKQNLKSFLSTKWDEKEEEYFENSPIHKDINTYMIEMFNGNNKNIQKYNKLMKSLSEAEKIARIEYMIKKMEKASLEFIAAYGNNKPIMEEFILHNTTGLSCARNNGMKIPEYPQDPYLN